MPFFIKKILFPILVLAVVFFITIHFINAHQSATASDNYILKTYKNTVALYKNDEIIKIYDNIVLNTLPEKDIQNFNAGIPVETQSHAEALLEDYDG